jgi:hypothetical protein
MGPNGQPVEHLVKHDDGTYGPDVSLARNDAIAAAALSGKSLARYLAYKQVVLAREQDPAAIVSTLRLFISDLSEANDGSAVRFRSGT